MVDPAILYRKLSRMAEYLDELEKIRPPSFEEYSSNVTARRAVERLIQLLVEVANDINVHAVVDAGMQPPHTYYDGFLQAATAGLLSEDLARQLAPSAGARNIIVREYETIDDCIVYENAGKALQLYREYARSVLAYLQR